MLWRHLRAVLIGPVLVTIAVPSPIAGTVGTGTVDLSQPLQWILVGLGTVLAAAGVAMLAWTIGLFGRVGQGTLSPFDPPRRLVVRGPYRHVRNPMFSGVLAICWVRQPWHAPQSCWHGSRCSLSSSRSSYRLVRNSDGCGSFSVTG